MTRAELIQLVERARVEHPTWFDLEPDQPPDAAQLHAVEEALGARLPADYLWFLTEYGGGDFAFAQVLSADPRSNLFITENQGSWLPDGVIAFAENGAGDAYVFPVEGDQAHDRVLLWDHETGEVRPSEPDFLTWLGRHAFGERAGA